MWLFMQLIKHLPSIRFIMLNQNYLVPLLCQVNKEKQLKPSSINEGLQWFKKNKIQNEIIVRWSLLKFLGLYQNSRARIWTSFLEPRVHLSPCDSIRDYHHYHHHHPVSFNLPSPTYIPVFSPVYFVSGIQPPDNPILPEFSSFSVHSVKTPTGALCLHLWAFQLV